MYRSVGKMSIDIRGISMTPYFIFRRGIFLWNSKKFSEPLKLFVILFLKAYKKYIVDSLQKILLISDPFPHRLSNMSDTSHGILRRLSKRRILTIQTLRQFIGRLESGERPGFAFGPGSVVPGTVFPLTTVKSTDEPADRIPKEKHHFFSWWNVGKVYTVFVSKYLATRGGGTTIQHLLQTGSSGLSDMQMMNNPFPSRFSP